MHFGRWFWVIQRGKMPCPWKRMLRSQVSINTPIDLVAAILTDLYALYSMLRCFESGGCRRFRDHFGNNWRRRLLQLRKRYQVIFDCVGSREGVEKISRSAAINDSGILYIPKGAYLCGEWPMHWNCGHNRCSKWHRLRRRHGTFSSIPIESTM